MSLSDDLRQELAAIEPHSDCDRRAELSGLFHTAGSFHLRSRGAVSVELDLSTSAVARRAFALLRDLRVEAAIRTYRRRAFDRATRYQLLVEGTPRALDVLRDAGVLAGRRPLERPPRRVVGRPCCRRAYLRGALLGGGSLTGPRAPHLELRFRSEAGAQLAARLARQEDVALRVYRRGEHAVAYARAAEPIADVLALAGASGAALAIDEHAVVGAARSRANRIANADHANIVRASRAAHEQLRAIRALAGAGVLDGLPPRLRDAADLRLRHPSASLGELAAKARPALTRSALHRRLRALVALAESDVDTDCN